MRYKPNGKAGGRRADPAKPERGEREEGMHGEVEFFQMQGSYSAVGKRVEECAHRCGQRKAYCPAVDAAVIAEEAAGESQRDEHYGKRAEEHQHGDRKFDYRVEPYIGNEK